jgi:hypothetical protein
MHSTPSHPISLRSTLILFSYPCLSISSGLLPSEQNCVCTSFLSYSMHATCPDHHTLLNFIILTFGGGCKSRSSSLSTFLQPCFTLFPLSPNTLLSTLFSCSLSLCSSLNVRDKVSYPYKTTGKIIVLHD